MHFYQRLKDMREDHEYEQKDIAKVLETTQQQYSKYERRRTADTDTPTYKAM